MALLDNLPAPANAIAYAHFERRNGWRGIRMLGLAIPLVVCVGVVFIMAGATNYGGNRRQAQINDGMHALTMILLIVQGAITMIFGAGSVAEAVGTDRQILMIESHRLSPLAGWQAAFGYLIGGAVLPLTAMIACAVSGLMASASVGFPIDGWIVASASQFLFAFVLWSFVLFSSLNSRGRIGRRSGIGWLIALTTLQSVAFVIPASFLIGGPIIHSFALGQISAPGVLPAGYFIAAVAQICLGAIYMTASARKFRNADQPAFQPILAILLLALWSAMNLLGSAFAKDFFGSNSSFARDNNSTVVGRAEASICTSMLLALLPLTAVIRANLHRKRQRVLGAALSRFHSMPAMFVVVLATLLIVPLFFIAADQSPLRGKATVSPTVASIAAAIAMFLINAGLVIRWRLRSKKPARMLMVLWFLLTWIGPLAVDWIRTTYSNANGEPALTNFAGYSPFGTIFIAWSRTLSPMPGLIGQAVLIFVTAFFTDVLLRPRKARPPAASQDPVVASLPV